MSAKNESIEPAGQGRGSFFTARLIERMTDPAEMIKFLNATNHLSDADFDRAVHDPGYRVVTLVQRGGAIKGDKKLVDACEVYLKRAKECLSQTRGRHPMDGCEVFAGYKPRRVEE
jgi:hypothetical protein